MAGQLDPPPTLRLDLRGLPAPQPMEHILARLHTLQPGQVLVALTPLYPAPLLPMLEQLGFACDARATDDGARLLICRAAERHLLDDPPAP
ncbi:MULTISPECIES: DUF2249 domain-containing protein [Stenotrophomonas]|uniref:DUF2249 domain-containing protein n=1 Tax=Stenotrophomonas TaxID=40323 RepID=UPI0006F7AF5F|nr:MULTISPECIES: DUF2249 domain-containing protein [Stenotrophomonas]KQO00332.1 hypothetical protein ASF01_05110 [Stenotrophomonas sp. Leaf70]